MTLDELFRGAYRWADANGAVLLILVGLAFPVAATLIALVGKGGKTDSDGKMLASIFIGAAILFAVLEIVAIFVGTAVFDASLLQANAALLATPLACFVLMLVGIKWVFPLNQLASIRTFGDLALLALLCGGLIWFFSKFRGWGIIFFGSIFQLVVVLAVVIYFIRRIFKRAFGLSGGRSEEERA